MDHKLKFKSAKGQLPFIELNGEEIADSAVIMSKLSEHFGIDPDAQLTKEEKNQSHALISMIENHLAWVYVYWRSKNPDSMIKVSTNQQSYLPKCNNQLFYWTEAKYGYVVMVIHNTNTDFDLISHYALCVVSITYYLGIQIESTTRSGLSDSKSYFDIFL